MFDSLKLHALKYEKPCKQRVSGGYKMFGHAKKRLVNDNMKLIYNNSNVVCRQNVDKAKKTKGKNQRLARHESLRGEDLGLKKNEIG